MADNSKVGGGPQLQVLRGGQQGGGQQPQQPQGAQGKLATQKLDLLQPGTVQQPTDGTTITSTGITKYSDAEFLMGHGTKWRPAERVQFKIDEAYLAEARRWIEGPFKGHYHSMNDLLVHAVVRHLTITLPGWEGAVEGSTLYQLKQMGDVCAEEEFELHYIKLIDRIGAVISSILELPGGKVKASAVLRRIKRHIEAMRPSFYKDHFAKMFNDRFAAYERQGLVILEVGGAEEDDAHSSLPDVEEMADELLQHTHTHNGAPKK